MAEPGAVPAAVARNHGLGRRRTPTPGHYEPGARSSQLAGHIGPYPSERGTDAGKHREWSAEGRAPFQKEGAPWLKGYGSLSSKRPLGAPLPSCVREAKRNDGAPAPQRTGQAERWLFEN